MSGKPSRRSIYLWLGLSLSVALVYGILGLEEAFARDFVVQDDARQHVFWMQRFIDPSLFPNDLIADYFQSVATPGYVLVYKLGAAIGIEPLVFNKLLPVGLGLLVAASIFYVTLELLPIPLAGWIASTMLLQNLWATDDLPSGTPRAFFYPLLLGFIYYLLRRNWWGCAGAIALQAAFYPPTVLLSAGMLVLQPWRWQNGRLKTIVQPEDYGAIAGLGLAVLLLLPYVLIESPYSPTVSFEQAMAMPEFHPGGRTVFFQEGWRFWLADRSGIISRPKRFFSPYGLQLAFILPLLIYPLRLPLVKRLSPSAIALFKLTLVSLSLFILAHLSLFTLYLPGRYTQHSLRIVFAIGAAISLTLLLESLLRWTSETGFGMGKTAIATATTALLFIAILTAPSTFEQFPKPNYKTGNSPEVYRYFARQPIDISIASLSEEANFIPSFAARSVLVSREVAIPYHLGYYRPLRQRAIALINAQYSPDRSELERVIDEYNIDFWLLDRQAWMPEYLAENKWLQQFQPATNRGIENLKAGITPAIAKEIPACTTLETETAIVLDARCLLSR